MNRKFIIAIATCMLLISSTIKAQETGLVVVDHSKDDFKSLLGNKGSHGGYLSIDITGGEVNNVGMFEAGGRLAWIANHSFAFGLAGYGFASNVTDEPGEINGAQSLAGGYGGLLLEPIIFSKEIVHLSVPLIAGIGGAGVYHDEEFNVETGTYQSGEMMNGDAFFMLRPGLEVEMNLSRFLRISLGGYYHHAIGLNIDGIDKDAINGMTYGVSIKFGWF